MRPAFLSTKWKEATWIQRLSGLMSEPLTAELGVASWIVSLGATPASRLVKLAYERGQMMKDTSGLILEESLESSNPEGSSLKMSQDTSASDLKKSYPTYEDLVIELKRDYLVRQKSDCLSLENDSLSWGTPNTLDYMPTERSPEATERIFSTHRKGRARPSNLREQVAKTWFTWPTPTAKTASSSTDPNSKSADWGNQHFHLSGVALKCGLQHLTILTDGNELLKEVQDSPQLFLNPSFVEWLMGMPLGWINSEPSEMQLSHWLLLMRGILSQIGLNDKEEYEWL